MRTTQPAAAVPAAKTLGQEIATLADDLARSGGTPQTIDLGAERSLKIGARALGQGPVPGFDPLFPKPVAGGTAESPGPCLF